MTQLYGAGIDPDVRNRSGALPQIEPERFDKLVKAQQESLFVLLEIPPALHGRGFF